MLCFKSGGVLGLVAASRSPVPSIVTVCEPRPVLDKPLVPVPSLVRFTAAVPLDPPSVVEGKRADLGGRRIIKKKNKLSEPAVVVRPLLGAPKAAASFSGEEPRVAVG